MIWQREDRAQAAELRASQGLAMSGAFVLDVERGAVTALIRAGSQATTEVSNVVRKSFAGDVPLEAASWIRGELVQMIDGIVTSLTRELEVNRRRMSVPEHGAGENLSRTTNSLKLDVDVEIAPIEFYGRLRAIAAGDLPSKASGARTIDAFISYAGEDRDDVAKPLADCLIALGYQVWYDRYELKVGPSVYRTIEGGLRECRFGTVVLSPRFFAKELPQRELAALAALAEAEGKNRILSVWHDIERAGIVKFSPMMADVWAAKTADGLDKVIEDLKLAIGPPSGAASPT